MISLRAKNIAELLNSVWAITSLSEVYAEKPKSELDVTYLYVSIVSDNVIKHWSQWPIMKQCQFNVNIICKETLWAAEYSEGVLYDVIDAINDNVVNKNCTHISDIDWVFTFGIYEWSVSSLWYIEDRPVITKSYFIKYSSK
jgi:hypothetical protein